MKLSVIILTKNEEMNILDCLESVSFADEIVIIDDFSIDRTLGVARSLKNKKIKIFQHKLEGDFSAQRNFGLSKAKGDWILFVDADERVPESLVSELSTLTTEATAFYIKRIDIMWGKKLLHGEMGNIKLIRLAKKNAGRWVGRVHEVWEVPSAKTSELKNELMHYPHQTIKEFISEISFYSTIRAKELHARGVKVSLIDIIIYPKAKFAINYFVKLGFLDGLPGFVAAIMMSFHSFLVRAKLWLHIF